MFTRRSFISSALAALVFSTGAAWAQTGSWPTRPVRIVANLPPGGSNDLLARLLAERLQPALGQPVIVENKPGASGNIGADYVAKQPADGYTLLLTPSSLVINPHFFAKLPFDPIKDFEPISLLSTVTFVLTVNAGVPAESMKEFVAHARANPGKLTYGSAGIGQPHHLAAELLKSMTGIDIVHVPYKGAGGIVPALLGGEISFTIGAINSLLPHIRTGKLRALGVAGGTRTPLLPDVPTIAEGVPLPGYELTSWAGVLAPAHTPRAIVDRLSTEVNQIIRDPQMVKEKLTPLGIQAVGTSPERLMEVMKADLALYAKLAKDANVKPE
jgi:tripartite-type tricarboxylate transporter receptor subunit TctC